jgi:hypothetical protein
MDAEARQRIRLATGRLVKRLGVSEPPTPAHERNPDVRAIRELEAHATFLEELDRALKDEGYSAAPGAEGKNAGDEGDLAEIEQDAAKDGETLTVAETKDGTPIVVTEDMKATKKGKS